MAIQNPYREIVLSDTDIMVELENIYEKKWQWTEHFWNTHPIVLEIGTGMGNYFSKQVWENPEMNYVWIELRYKRLYYSAEKCRKTKNEWENKNFIMLKDFGQNIDKIFCENEISETYVFFPDPWGKKNTQKKHRLLQADFLANLYSITKVWGKLFYKTDHREYFETTLKVIEGQWLWKISKMTQNYEDDEIFDTKNITEFEAMYRWDKIEINYVELVK